MQGIVVLPPDKQSKEEKGKLVEELVATAKAAVDARIAFIMDEGDHLKIGYLSNKYYPEFIDLFQKQTGIRIGVHQMNHRPVIAS